MSDPKYSLGDLVDIRCQSETYNGVEISALRYIKNMELVECTSAATGKECYAAPGYWYSHSGESLEHLVHEKYIYPHQKPSEVSFEDTMHFLKHVNTPADTNKLIERVKL